MKPGGLVALVLSFILGMTLFLTAARGGTCWFTVDEDGNLMPNSFERRFGKMEDIPREELPSELNQVLKPGDQVATIWVTCWRLPFFRHVKQAGYMEYEPHRGGSSLGRYAEGKRGFYVLLGVLAISPIMAWPLVEAALRLLFPGRKEAGSP